MNHHSGKINEHHVMILYYKISCSYFGNGKYDKCIFFLKKINENKTFNLGEDLLCFERILNLLANYEAMLDYRLEALIKSTHIFLSKMNNLHEVQKAIIDFLKRISQISPLEIKSEFKKLHSVLIKFKQDPFERKAFLYLDLISWQESKMSEQTIASVIAVKIKEKNK